MAEGNKWDGFNPTTDWLIPTTNNGGAERVLIVEADSSVGEQALALGVSSQIDLDIAEVGQAFVALGALMRRAVEQEQGITAVPASTASTVSDTAGGSSSEQGAREDAGDGAPPAVRLVRVLLADSSMPIQTGGGASTSLRQSVTDKPLNSKII